VNRHGIDALSSLYGVSFRDEGESTTRGVVTTVGGGRCSVVCEDGRRYFDLPWPNTQLSPTGAGMTVSPPEPGMTVIVHRGRSGVRISQSYDQTPALGSRKSTFSVSDAGVTQPPGVNGQLYKGAYADDLCPGDRLYIGNQGQKSGILEGGVALLSASPMCGIWAFLEDDTLRAVARNFKLDTTFGNLQIFDRGGKAGLSFIGGTDKLTESGPGVGNPTIKFNIGNTSSGILDWSFTSNTGEQMWSSGLSSSGDRSENIYGSRSVTVGQQDILYAGAGRSVTVGDGADVLNVQNGNMTRGASGSMNFEANQAFTVRSGSNIVMNSFRDIMLTGSSSVNMAVGPGNPLGGKIQLSNFDPNPLAAIILDTLNPIDSVKLGSIMGIAPFHAAKFETLSAFLSALIIWNDTHVHAAPGTPPTVPSASTLAGLIPAIMSLKVAIGM
jgi:hypothetical protein